MKQRKEIKKRSKTSLKNHYAIFLAACLIAAFLGSEFSSSLNISSADDQLVQSIETEEDFQTRVSGITWTDVLEIIAAVSYTHLDVYKRQLHSSWMHRQGK